MTIGIKSAALVSIFVQSILFGLFLFFFLLSCYHLWVQRPKGESFLSQTLKIWVVLGAMMTLASIHIGATLWRVLWAFVWIPGDETAQALGSTGTKNYLLRVAIYEAQTLVGDGFIIYRLYVVWGKNVLPCFPVMMTFLGSVAAAIESLYQDTRPSKNSSIRYSPEENVWDTAFPSLTLFTNGYATVLIAARIWYFRRKTREALNDSLGWSLGRTAAIVLESGALYSATLVPLIVLYQMKNDVGDILYNCVPQIIGIVFSVIIVRVAAGVSQGKLVRKATIRGVEVSTMTFRRSVHHHIDKLPEPVYLRSSTKTSE